MKKSNQLHIYIYIYIFIEVISYILLLLHINNNLWRPCAHALPRGGADIYRSFNKIKKTIMKSDCLNTVEPRVLVTQLLKGNLPDT